MATLFKKEGATETMSAPLVKWSSADRNQLVFPTLMCLLASALLEGFSGARAILSNIHNVSWLTKSPRYQDHLSLMLILKRKCRRLSFLLISIMAGG